MVETPLFFLKDINFSYGETPVLHHLSLEIASGAFYGLVGPNGCGKTTLLDLLTGSLRPGSGTLHFQGRSLTEISRREIARQIALVPQEFDPGFGFTVEELVLMGRHPHITRFGSPTADDWRQVEDALQTIGISELRHRQCTQLSGGQKQRAVVARALAQDTPVLLFDEATSNLDIKYSLQIFDTARTLTRQGRRTVIAVMHDLNLAAAYCDELLFLSNGRIVQRGKTESILTPDTVSAVFGVDCQVSCDPFTQRLRVSLKSTTEK